MASELPPKTAEARTIAWWDSARQRVRNKPELLVAINYLACMNSLGDVCPWCSGTIDTDHTTDCITVQP